MKKLFIYSGHSEVVGGDVKFIVDFINECPKDEFEIILFTDKHCHFEKLSQKWLKRDLKVHYIPTLPVIFSQHFPLNILNLMETIAPIGSILKKQIAGKSIKHFIDFFFRIITLYDYRIAISNFLLFRQIFNKEKGIDIFFFNNGGYPAKIAGLSACIAAKSHGIPNIVMAFHNIPAKRRPFSIFDALIDKMVDRSLHHVIAVSEVLKQDLISKRDFSPEKIVVSYCGLEDQSPLTQAEKEKLKNSLNLPEKKCILITGNLNEKRKGHEFLIEALGKVKKHFPDFSFLIVGGGSEQRVNEIKEKLKTENLENETYFLGHRFDIHSINSIVDIVIVPSIGVEATPYTIKEGYRASKPVITTNRGGCAEGVIEGQTGFVVESENPTMLAEKILILLENSNLSQLMGENGRSFYLSNFELKFRSGEITKILKNE